MKKIYWDKGHGGSDPGAVGNGLKEKDINDDIIEHAMNYMVKHFIGFEQMTSRVSDRTVSLMERTTEANKWGADVFISSHVNAGGGTGFETFIHPNAKGLTTVLQDAIHYEVLKAIQGFNKTVKDRGQKRANFSVLRESWMPAVLTEILFIDTNDYKYLKDHKFRKAVGEAYAIAVGKVMKLKKVPAPPKEHIIQSGETLSGIAKKYKTTVNKIMDLNPQLKDEDKILSGNRLVIKK